EPTCLVEVADLEPQPCARDRDSREERARRATLLRSAFGEIDRAPCGTELAAPRLDTRPSEQRLVAPGVRAQRSRERALRVAIRFGLRHQMSERREQRGITRVL